jgi:hypothetical protein
LVFSLDERGQYSKTGVFGEGEQMRVELLNELVIAFPLFSNEHT